ncbi:MAG TPA: methyl-accepting chemotaxis protein [Pseudobdellovibrionaceae bacterium]|nr:methyl-accepting chemotaxis protein [Pseudobdellovibrionaceae bacterium]
MSQFSVWYGTVRGRLTIAAVVPVACLILVGGISEYQSMKLGSMLKESYGTIIPNLKAVGEMLYHRGNISIYANAALDAADTEKRKSAVDFARKEFDAYAKARKAYEDAPNIPGEDEIYNEIKGRGEKFAKVTSDVFTMIEKATPEADKDANSMLNGSWIEEARAIRYAMEKISDLYAKHSAEKDKLQEEARASAHLVLLLTTGIFAVAVAGYMFFLSRTVSNKVIAAASGLSATSLKLSSATDSLSKAGSNLSTSSTGAAASLEETVASLEELTSMVKNNSDNAKEAANLSQASCQIAEEGEAEIKKLISSMTDISDSSRKIEEIINVIDDIAFQTNLLALNAAVEAARAGEQGKGFAVVAEAVRSLAQRSASAAKDISHLIKESVHKIDQGVNVAGKSGDVLTSIVQSVKKVANLNGEISTASEEQTRGINQISSAMNQLDQITQANAASSEEIAGTSTDISQQTQQMVEYVVSLNELSGENLDQFNSAA